MGLSPAQRFWRWLLVEPSLVVLEANQILAAAERERLRESVADLSRTDEYSPRHAKPYIGRNGVWWNGT